jgi:cytoskeletal protein CcmA (bactofilin family)
MKKLVIFLVFILFTMGSLFSFTLDLENAQYGSLIEIKPNENIEDSFTGFGASIINEGTAESDFQAFAAEVFIPGSVKENLDVFAARVDIRGNIGGDMTFGCASLDISGNINGKLQGGAASITLSGNFGDDVDISGAVVRLSGNYDGDVKINSDNIIINPGTKIKGDLLYSATEIDIPDDAEVGGEIKHFIVEKKPEKEKNPFLSYLFEVLWKIGAYFLIGLILWIIIPERLNTIITNITGKPLRSLLWGILSIIVIPILSVILLFTFIGIPSGIFMGIGYAILLYVSQVIAGIFIGYWILRLLTKNEKVHLLLATLVGVIAYSIIASIPIFGWLIFIASAIFSIGSVLSTIWNLRKATI